MYFLIKKGINKNPVCYYFFNFTNGFNSQCLVIRCAFIKHILMIFKLLSAAWNSKAGYPELRHVFDGAARISEGQRWYVLWVTDFGVDIPRVHGTTCLENLGGRWGESTVCEPGHFSTSWILDHFPTTTLLDKYECRGKEVHLSKVQFLQTKLNSRL